MTVPLLGVIGGMGPLATLDFLQKVVAETGAADDAGQIPMRIEWRPDTPNRQAWAAGTGDSPLPALKAAVQRLMAGEACNLMAMPCNTTHIWYDELLLECPVPFVHIADACLPALERLADPGAAVAVLGTRETAAFDIYGPMLRRAGWEPLYPPQAVQSQLLYVIAAVKGGRLTEARSILGNVYRSIHSMRCEAIILACTELPMITTHEQWCSYRLVDSGLELARDVVGRWLTLREQ